MEATVGDKKRIKLAIKFLTDKNALDNFINNINKAHCINIRSSHMLYKWMIYNMHLKREYASSHSTCPIDNYFSWMFSKEGIRYWHHLSIEFMVKYIK